MALVNLATGLPANEGLRYLTQPSGALVGMSVPQLQAALASAQAAYTQMLAGGKVTSASYAQGDGSKSATYNITSVAQVRGFIYELQRALGMVGVARRPMRPWF